VSRPLYVAFEGIDTCGKSTLAKLVSNTLRSQGRRVVVKSEFPVQEIGALKEALASANFLSEGFRYGPVPALFYVLYLESISLSRIGATKADFILMDRYIDSIAAYQGYFATPALDYSPVPLVQVLENLFEDLGLSITDLSIYLQISERTLSHRFFVRHKRILRVRERRTFRSITKNYEILFRERRRFVAVNADGSLSDIVEKCLALILESSEKI